MISPRPSDTLCAAAPENMESLCQDDRERGLRLPGSGLVIPAERTRLRLTFRFLLRASPFIHRFDDFFVRF